MRREIKRRPLSDKRIPVQPDQHKKSNKSFSVWYIISAILSIFIFAGSIFAINHKQKPSQQIPSKPPKTIQQPPVKKETNTVEEPTDLQEDTPTPDTQEEEQIEQQPVEKEGTKKTDDQVRPSRSTNQERGPNRDRLHHGRTDRPDPNRERNENTRNHQHRNEENDHRNRSRSQDPSLNPPAADEQQTPPDEDRSWWEGLFNW